VNAGGVSAANRAAWERHLGRPVDVPALIAELTEGSIAQLAHATALRRPGAPALAIGGERLTHGELDHRAGVTAAWLAGQGVRPGDRVLLSAPNCMGFVIAYLATLRLGGVVVLASPTLTAPELSYIVTKAGAVAALGAGPVLGRLREVTGLARVFDVDLATATTAEAGPPPVAVPADSPALIAFTSGTTGRPKAVPLTHANVLSSVRAAMLAWRWTSRDVLVHALPLTHQHGLSGIHATILAGSAAVIHEQLDAEALCRSVAAEPATVLFAVPAVYERLTAWDGIRGVDLSSLRLRVSGSAPLGPALACRIEDTMGELALERYGSTEAGLDVSNPYDGPRRVGSVGLPLPGVELCVVDASGAPVATGADGEIVIRGPQVFAGYEGDLDATAGSFFEGGWFRTGDIGRVDPADGYLAITGRAKELIITGGLNVYPREVELALEAEPAVERAAVAGVPSERWGEEVVALVVPASGAAVDPESLIASVRSRLAPYKCPKRVIVVEEIPVNAVGKVVRPQIAEFAASLDGYRAATRQAARLVHESVWSAPA
jgi:malonyl-CoA/methylmalonyl-CoA synthetase